MYPETIAKLRTRLEKPTKQLSCSPSLLEQLTVQNRLEHRQIQKFFIYNLKYSLNRSDDSLDNWSAFMAAGGALQTRLIDDNKYFQMALNESQKKRVSFLSLEWLMGRIFTTNLLKTDLLPEFKIALHEYACELEIIAEEEHDTALGRGGLGRIAACFFDSLATLNMPAFGYGIRYTYGMFRQKFENGYQIEMPEYWLTYGNPFLIRRLDVAHTVKFGGFVSKTFDSTGKIPIYEWKNDSVVQAVAYDTLVPGYVSNSCLTLRLWASMPIQAFDFSSFSKGDYYSLIEERQEAETLTAVMFTEDITSHEELYRLKQYYFFVSATLQDIFSAFDKLKKDICELPTYNAIHLNASTICLAIPEMIRILYDERQISWKQAWKISEALFSCTIHTVSNKKTLHWTTDLLKKVLPRHLEIIYQINQEFLTLVKELYPDDSYKLCRASLIQESNQKRLKMGHLAIIGSHHVNGVSLTHCQKIVNELFPVLYEIFPEKFLTMSSGVSFRRWIKHANPMLGTFFDLVLNTKAWVTDSSKLSDLSSVIDSFDVIQQFQIIKQQNKERLAQFIFSETGVAVSSCALFDGYVKGFRSARRHLLLLFAIIYRYHLIVNEHSVKYPRVIILSGKAYRHDAVMKCLIKFAHCIANVVNNDQRVNNLLKLVIIPDYNVTKAEEIIPGLDITEQLSIPGSESSGTGQIKAVLNGTLVLGTWEACTKEIFDKCGVENHFPLRLSFESLAESLEEIALSRHTKCEKFDIIINMINSEIFGPVHLFEPLLQSYFLNKYLIKYDFEEYLQVWDDIEDSFYNHPIDWTKKCLSSISRMQDFSSDEVIKSYCKDIWNIEAVQYSSRFRSRSFEKNKSKNSDSHFSPPTTTKQLYYVDKFGSSPVLSTKKSFKQFKFPAQSQDQDNNDFQNHKSTIQKRKFNIYN
eukprot:TRINITY_DN750_c0_g1_i1.p1 TRINITY_DN750_c0_g1~~TRINITY_DN750_c0_g1_i1.p1  ORF type:complete len:922 (+),score=196.61 TRINITY_DN750_c0_g1_i1:48-2813(+)